MESIPKEQLPENNFKGDFVAKQEIKTETIKTHIQVWNEYFTAFVLFPVQQGQILSEQHMNNLIVGSGVRADLMLAEYQKRLESLNGG